MANTNQSWKTSHKAKEILSIQTSTHENDTHREDRGFRRVGVSCPQGEQPDTKKPGTLADTSRNVVVRLRNLRKNESTQGRETTPWHSQGKYARPPENTRMKEIQNRSTNKILLRRQRCETLGPEKESLHLGPSPSTCSRGREQEIPATRNRPLRTVDLRH
ncbi:unnamed protein product [Arabidopsis lyrata]|uniref:Predicted protein n=1 Tax=Arabidopsis lyrata subsp. lyrata TaxID=81972 RepID=D7LE85_ARALL|nr:predicted protein [Arabidopsis lyrata subsp. lyrata]CAH8263732.1 unnamed protein product [Arabidopsis lyrata]